MISSSLSSSFFFFFCLSSVLVYRWFFLSFVYIFYHIATTEVTLSFSKTKTKQQNWTGVYLVAHSHIINMSKLIYEMVFSALVLFFKIKFNKFCKSIDLFRFSFKRFLFFTLISKQNKMQSMKISVRVTLENLTVNWKKNE